MDLRWLYDIYHSQDSVGDKIQVHRLFRSEYSLEDFINSCLENISSDFIHDKINPDIANNSVTAEQDAMVTKLATALFTTIHMHLEEILDNDDSVIPSRMNNNIYNLVGFLGTSAIIAVGEDVDFNRDGGDAVSSEVPRYPTFQEAYGDLRIKKWRDEIVTNPLLETFIPVIHGKCIPPSTF